MSDFGVNAEIGDFYNAGSLKDSIELDIVRERKDTILSNFEKLYERSQTYYKDKYKKQYDTKTIKLYRGVGLEEIDTYIPGALESWTTNVSTAKLFAEMMAPPPKSYYSKKNTGSIMMAEVPIQDIFGSWDSFSETWMGEEDLKGKKEYIVMGGTFATTPIYKYDPKSKETYGNVQTFKEWSLYEGKNMKKNGIKITTPSMKGFDKILKSGKAALGNDPKEAEVRKIDDEN